MARAPFSIEWLSQSSRCSQGPNGGSGGAPTISGPAISELGPRSGDTLQLGMYLPGPWSLCESPSAPVGPPLGHSTPKTGSTTAVSPRSHLEPQKAFAAGGADSGYESEASRSDCVSPPDKDSRRCPSPGAQQPEELDASLYPAEGELYTVDCASIREDSAVPCRDEMSSPYPAEEDSSAYHSDGPQEEGEGGRVSRRLRTAFSSEQIGSLEKTFKRQRYLSAFERRKLAARLQLSEVQLKTWFQNRRMKLKRQLQDQQPDPFCHAPFLRGMPFGQQVYPSFYPCAAPGTLPIAHCPAGLAYGTMGPSTYPRDPYTGHLQPHLQHTPAYGYY